MQLACDRGPPSLNQGHLNTRLLLREGRAVFETSEYRRRCVLTFDFESSGAVIAQQGDDADCGFGFGVYAAGRYERRSTTVPSLDLSPEEPPPPAGVH